MVKLSESVAVQERDPLDILFKGNVSISSSISRAFSDLIDEDNSGAIKTYSENIILDPNMYILTKFLE